MLRFVYFSLKSCGINYSDPFPLEYPKYINSYPVINQYLHRLRNFHSAPSMKYLYRFVSVSAIQRRILFIRHLLTHFSCSTFSFSYSSPTYSCSSSKSHQVKYHRLTGLRSWQSFSSPAWWSKKGIMWVSTLNQNHPGHDTKPVILFQFCTLDSLSFFGKVGSYYRNRFKIMGTISFFLFFIGLILRFTLTRDEDNFTAAR